MKILTIKKNQAGMTLLETMITIAIIVLVGSLVGPKVFNQFTKAKVGTTKTQIKSLESTLQMYKLDNGSYPSTSQGLDALITKPNGYPEAKNWDINGYINKVPKDAWGNEFNYISPGLNSDFEIISFGADGMEGGSGYDSDIVSNED